MSTLSFASLNEIEQQHEHHRAEAVEHQKHALAELTSIEKEKRRAAREQALLVRMADLLERNKNSPKPIDLKVERDMETETLRKLVAQKALMRRFNLLIQCSNPECSCLVPIPPTSMLPLKHFCTERCYDLERVRD